MLFYRRRSWASLFVSPLLSLPRPYLHTRTNLLRLPVQDATIVGQRERCALMILLFRMSAGLKKNAWKFILFVVVFLCHFVVVFFGVFCLVFCTMDTF